MGFYAIQCLLSIPSLYRRGTTRIGRGKPSRRCTAKWGTSCSTPTASLRYDWVELGRKLTKKNTIKAISSCEAFPEGSHPETLGHARSDGGGGRNHEIHRRRRLEGHLRQRHGAIQGGPSGFYTFHPPLKFQSRLPKYVNSTNFTFRKPARPVSVCSSTYITF